MTAAALGVRAAYVVAVGADLPLVGDPQTYHLAADLLAEGRGYIRPWGLIGVDGDVPTAEFPPLFPAVLALFDLAGIDSPLGQKLALTPIGAASVFLIGWSGRRLATPTAGLAAAALAAGHPAFFQLEAALAAETLYACAIAGIATAATYASRRPHWLPWALVGLLVGVAALVRSEAILLVALIAMPLAIRAPLSAGARRRIELVAVAAAACVAAVTPWIVRNALVLDAFVPISSNAGTLVAGANCAPAYRGDEVGLWHFNCVLDTPAPSTSETARNRAYLRAGLGYAIDHADEVPKVVAIRVLRTWGLYDPVDQVAWETFESRHLQWHRAGYAVHAGVLSLAVPGYFLLRRRPADRWVLTGLFVLVTMVSAAGYGNQRLRVAADVGLVILAGITLSQAPGVAARWRRARGLSRRSSRSPRSAPARSQ